MKKRSLNGDCDKGSLLGSGCTQDGSVGKVVPPKEKREESGSVREEGEQP